MDEYLSIYVVGIMERNLLLQELLFSCFHIVDELAFVAGITIVFHYCYFLFHKQNCYIFNGHLEFEFKLEQIHSYFPFVGQIRSCSPLKRSNCQNCCLNH